MRGCRGPAGSGTATPRTSARQAAPAAGGSRRGAHPRPARTGRRTPRRRAPRPRRPRNSITVTTPKLPPPPRSAQKRSGWWSASTRTQASVGGDELERGDGVCLQAVPAREPPHPAAERVAGDPDVGRRAVQAGEPVCGQSRRHPFPLDAGPDANSLRAGVDLDLLQRADVYEEHVVHGRLAAPGCAPWPAVRRAARRGGRG